MFAAPFDVVLSDLDVVEPDILFVSTARLSLVTEKNLRGAPDLAIEILSEATRRTDETAKRSLYERFGVQEYWVVDAVVENVRIFRREGATFRRATEMSKAVADSLSTPLLPGLAIPLAEIFE